MIINHRTLPRLRHREGRHSIRQVLRLLPHEAVAALAGQRGTRNMNAWETLKQFVSTVTPQTVHLHGLAATGAMLTCVAIALNVGPFAKPPDYNVALDKARSETARLALEQNVAGLMPVSDLQTGMSAISTSIDNPHASIDNPHATAEVTEINMAEINAAETIAPPMPTPPPLLPVGIELASSVSQPATPVGRSGETEDKPLQGEQAPAVLTLATQTDDADADAAKNATIVGVWAPNAGTCSARDFRDGALPAVISTDGAWAGETFCMFSNKKQTQTGWSVTAKCASPKERWTVNVRLTVKDNKLTWTSKRGTQAYSRCSPDVLMAAAR